LYERYSNHSLQHAGEDYRLNLHRSAIYHSHHQHRERGADYCGIGIMHPSRARNSMLSSHYNCNSNHFGATRDGYRDCSAELLRYFPKHHMEYSDLNGADKLYITDEYFDYSPPL